MVALVFLGVVLLLGGTLLWWRPNAALRLAAKVRMLPRELGDEQLHRKWGVALALCGVVLVVFGVSMVLL